MMKFGGTALLTLFSFLCFGQRTVITDKAVVKEELKLNGAPVSQIDTSLTGATHDGLPTTKAVENAIADSGVATPDTITFLTQDSILIQESEGLEVHRDTIRLQVGSGSSDNLGDHTATQAINLNGNFLSGDGDNEGIYIDTDGGVGIGIPYADRADVEISGSTFFKGDNSPNGTGLLANSTSSDGPFLASHTNGSNQSTANYIASRWKAAAAGHIFQTSPATIVGNARSWTQNFAIQPSGNVLIGTGAASYILDINSTDAVRFPVGTDAQRPTNALGIVRGSSTGTDLEWGDGTHFWKIPKSSVSSFTLGSILFAGSSGEIAENNSNLFWDNSTTRLGIGTNIPTASISASTAQGIGDPALYVSGSNSSDFVAYFGANHSSGNHAYIQIGNSSTNMNAGIDIGAANAAQIRFVNAGNPSFKISKASDESNLGFFYWNGSAEEQALALKNNGNLGVGTSNPQQDLHVEGTVRITSSSGTATSIVGRNVDGDVSTVTPLSGSGAPASTPLFIGQLYIDTTGSSIYMAAGVSNSGGLETNK